MIKTKLKTCSNCNELTVLWKSSPKLCKDCYYKLKSKGEIKTSKSLSSVKSKVSAGKIKSISDKRLLALKEYRVVRDKYLKDNPICEFQGCNSTDVDLHHKKPRAYHLCDVSVFMSVCRFHHNFIHDNDAKSRELGYLISGLSK